jgi:hypothetical protein
MMDGKNLHQEGHIGRIDVIIKLICWMFGHIFASCSRYDGGYPLSEHVRFYECARCGKRLVTCGGKIVTDSEDDLAH